MTNGIGRSIVFFATAWGTRYGGINSFNFDICRALAKLVRDKYEVICIVPCGGKKEAEEAKKEGVRLVKLRFGGDETRFVREDIEEVKKLFRGSSEDEVLWWIGHDVKTGPIAINAAQEIGVGRAAVFHHMDYESYLALTPINTQEPIIEQRNVLNQANIVFAIGPRLARSARDKVSGSDGIKVKQIFPGLHDVEGLKAPEVFSAIVLGRLSAHTNCVRQARLAVAGFGHACSDENYPSLGNESKIMVIGVPGGKQGHNERQQLKAIAAENAGREVQVHPWSYFEDREDLFEELRRKSVCLVTSLYEGFGLVGWEAICAEVPLIVSENTGLYEFISEHILGGRACLESIDIKGSSKGDYLKEDITKVSKAILKVRNNIEKAKREAVTLKEMIKNIYTWENCASSFAKYLGIITKETKGKELFWEDREDKIERRGEVDRLIRELEATPIGTEGASRYHGLAIRMLEYIFHPYLGRPRKEQHLHEGRKRVDIVFKNQARDGFFFDVSFHHYVGCYYIFFECKNYASDPKNPELDQLAGRFSDKRGMFGVLVCRSISDKETMWQRCRDTLADNRGYIVPLDDCDMKHMLRLRGNGDFKGINDYLDDKFRKLVM